MISCDLLLVHPYRAIDLSGYLASVGSEEQTLARRLDRARLHQRVALYFGCCREAGPPGSRRQVYSFLDALAVDSEKRKGTRRSSRVRLEAIRLGGRWFTSREALQRFAEKLTSASLHDAADMPESARTKTHREKASEQAAKKLEQLGI